MTATTDQGALLRAICADPEDTAARLVYADLLEEAGQTERAEFIKVQVELEQRSYRNSNGSIDSKCCCRGWRESIVCPTCNALRRRERELLLNHWHGWHQLPNVEKCCLNLVAAEKYPTALGLLFRNGFVEIVICSLADWYGQHGEGHGPAIVLAQPVREVVTEREPAQAYGGYCWFAHGPRYPDPDVIPKGLVPAMNAEVKRNTTACALGDLARFDTRAEALAALSAALIRWARQKAGLPVSPTAGRPGGPGAKIQ